MLPGLVLPGALQRIEQDPVGVDEHSDRHNMNEILTALISGQSLARDNRRGACAGCYSIPSAASSLWVNKGQAVFLTGMVGERGLGSRG